MTEYGVGARPSNEDAADNAAYGEARAIRGGDAYQLSGIFAAIHHFFARSNIYSSHRSAAS